MAFVKELLNPDADVDTITKQLATLTGILQNLTATLASQGSSQGSAPTTGTRSQVTQPSGGASSQNMLLNLNIPSATDIVHAGEYHNRGYMKEDSWIIASSADGGQNVITVNALDNEGINVQPSAAATYQNAELMFLEGNNQGVRTTIRSLSSSSGQTTIKLNDDLPQNASNGDAILVLRPLYPSTDLVQLTTISNQAANGNFAKVVAPYSGVATVQINTPSGGNLGLSVYDTNENNVFGPLNDGNALTAGQWYTFQFGLSAGATYYLYLETAQSGNLQVSIEGAATA